MAPVMSTGRQGRGFFFRPAESPAEYEKGGFLSAMKKHRSLILALVTMMLWGSLYPMVQKGFAAYEVNTTADILLFAGIRFMVCGAAVCIYAAFKEKGSYRPVKKVIPGILWSGFFAIVLHYSFTYLGLDSTDSSKTALIKQVGSLFYVCFSFLFFKEDRPTVQKIIAALAGFLGIVALNLSAEGISFSIGDLLILGASFSLMFSNVISKKVFSVASPVTATGISHFFGGTILLIVGLAMGGQVSFRLDSSLLIFAYICTASSVSYCLWFIVLKDGELSKLYIIKFSEAIFTCIFGAIIMKENIWKLQYLAALVLICGGILISNIKRKEKVA